MSGTKKRTWVKSAFNELSCSQIAVNDVSPRVLRKTKSTDALLNNSKSNSKNNSVFNITTTSNTHPLTDTTNGQTNGTQTLPMPNSNWIDSFAPTIAEDLAIHVKKSTDLQNWFQHCNALHKKHPAQFCLITGPAGSGKTTAVRVLAKAAGYELQEWINPLDREMITTLGDQPVGNSYVTSQLDTFKSFLLRASRYKSLLVQQQKRLLLVEDFPNALLSDSETFQCILDEYLYYGKSPLVFIVADSKTRGLNISFNLFTDQIKNKYNINHINLNPIAITLMQKAMKRFCSIMRKDHATIYQVPTQEIIDSILVSAQGDIRNALINLHFASLKGAPGMATKTLIMASETTNKAKRKKHTALKSVGRDESITMLHALGRVFNPKYTNEKKFLHSPEEIADCFSTEPKKFNDFMHANYMAHFSDIEHVVEALNGLSLSDLILNEYRENSLAVVGLNVGIRSVMVANAAPVAGWLPIRGPKRLNVVTRNEAQQNISNNLYATEFASYVKLIQASNKSNSLKKQNESQ